MSSRKRTDWNYLGRPIPHRGSILRVRDLRTGELESLNPTWMDRALLPEIELRAFERRVGNGEWDGLERRGESHREIMKERS